jgi:hypothetical protein
MVFIFFCIYSLLILGGSHTLDPEGEKCTCCGSCYRLLSERERERGREREGGREGERERACACVRDENIALSVICERASRYFNRSRLGTS